MCCVRPRLAPCNLQTAALQQLCSAQRPLQPAPCSIAVCGFAARNLLPAALDPAACRLKAPAVRTARARSRNLLPAALDLAACSPAAAAVHLCTLWVPSLVPWQPASCSLPAWQGVGGNGRRPGHCFGIVSGWVPVGRNCFGNCFGIAGTSFGAFPGRSQTKESQNIRNQPCVASVSGSRAAVNYNDMASLGPRGVLGSGPCVSKGSRSVFWAKCFLGRPGAARPKHNTFPRYEWFCCLAAEGGSKKTLGQTTTSGSL